jgi:hypothetical protein
MITPSDPRTMGRLLALLVVKFGNHTPQKSG